MSISDNLKKIQKNLSTGVTLVAVSKTKPIESIQEAYEIGHRDFGENKVQELCDKYEALPQDINWHLIGHLQTNKVKYIAPFVNLIHAVDSRKLTKEIQKRAGQCERKIDILVQLRIAKEETKFGLPYPEAADLLAALKADEFPNVRVVGLMGMASNTEDQEQIREEFIILKTFFDEQKALNSNLIQLSMGMSGDYPMAMDCGSNMVRIGSAIFGSRNYN
ncbi:MAG: pyridoxal phosphate enzyme (YggS family) [Salibacteraceae bacterium]|jgi:pyridoxal phosphate enzyme (YggS family)